MWQTDSGILEFQDRWKRQDPRDRFKDRWFKDEIQEAGGHYAIILETKKKQDSSILFLENAKGDLCSFKAVRKVNEVNCHKKKEQLVAAYRNTGWRSPDLVIGGGDNDMFLQFEYV